MNGGKHEGPDRQWGGGSMGMSVRARAAVIGVVAMLGLAATPSMASADEWYNDYTIVGLPEYVTGPTPFSVEVEGPDAVCGMEFDGQSVPVAPFTFMYDPMTSAGSDVEVTLCDPELYRDQAYVKAEIPFRFMAMSASADGGSRTTYGSVLNRTANPATVTVTDRKGRVLASEVAGPNGGTADVRVPLAGITRTTTYRVTAATADGLTMTSPLVVTKGWAIFSFYEGTVANFAPCSTIPWSYDAAGQPAEARTMATDVARGLARLSRLTGLRFVRTAPSADASLRFDWQNLGSGGPSGMGGTDGSVTFNNRDWWPHDSHAGFGTPGGVPGRGWLVIHEVMHVLGFDHVADRTQVMNPLAYQHHFGRGDLEGLRTVYPKAGCRG